MIIPYKVTDIRFTQSMGWVMDGYLDKDSILPVSVPFKAIDLLSLGCFNHKLFEIRNMFERELAREYNSLFQ